MVSWRAYARYVVARGLPSISSMLMTLVCVRALAPQDYGRYALLLAPVLMAAGFAAAVSSQSMLRWGLELPERERGRALVHLPLGLALLALVPLWLALPTVESFLLPIVLAMLLVPLSALLDTRRSLFVAAGQANRVLRLDGLRAVIALAIATVAFSVGPAEPTVPLAALVGAALLSLWAVPAAVPIAPGATRRVDGTYLRYGGWFALWVLVQGGMALAERHLVSAGVGLTEAGLYAARTDVFTAICSAFGGIAGAALMPRYLEVADRPNPAVEAALLRVGLATTGLAAVGGASLLAVVHLLPADWTGPALRGELALTVAVLAAALVWLQAVFVHKPLELGGRTDWMWGCIMLSAGVFAATAWLGLRLFGPTGVAVAKVLAGLVYIGLVTRLGGRVTRHGRERAA